MHFSKDSLYAKPLGDVSAFAFDEAVVKVFPDMIVRSVPGYAAIVSAIGLLASQFCSTGSRCFDLGCSLGAAALAMHEQIQVQDAKIIAVDNSPAMVDRLRQQLAHTSGADRIEVHCCDIRDIDITHASVVVLNFTLQFIPLGDRAALLRKIYQGMLPGGILILSEKLACHDARQQALQIQMHHHFKKLQGYSDLEISQKRTALENVLIPESFDIHKKRLQTVGFDSVELWFQYFNFASMIALK